MKKCPKWLKSWLKTMRSSAGLNYESQVDLTAIRGARVRPVFSPDVDVNELPKLSARVGAKLSKAKVQHAFRLDFYHNAGEEDEKHVRSFCCGWRPSTGSFVVSECSKGAVNSTEQPWIIESTVSCRTDQLGDTDHVYEHLNTHLLAGGRAVGKQNFAQIRHVHHFLMRLGLDCRSKRAAGDHRVVPVLFSGEADSRNELWLSNVARTVAARVVVPALCGSSTYMPRARAMIGLSDDQVEQLGAAWGWGTFKKRSERQLERDLVSRFNTWMGHLNPEVNRIKKARPRGFDGQIPDILFEVSSEAHPHWFIVEAKLGYRRSHVRTGLSQAREYGFYARNRPGGSKTALLLAVPPSEHGGRFARFVVETAQLLELAVIVETVHGGFRVWPDRHSTATAWQSGEFHMMDEWTARLLDRLPE